jgi:hypothetical protein
MDQRKTMINITITEYVNGYSVTAYDSKDGYVVNEIHEEYLEVLKVLNTYTRSEIAKLEKQLKSEI